MHTKKTAIYALCDIARQYKGVAARFLFFAYPVNLFLRSQTISATFIVVLQIALWLKSL